MLARARKPGVSVVSMSWGFRRVARPSSPAMRLPTTRVFTTPGVQTFVASTGDRGVADPEYPAYSPNVVAVGGTSLALNADGSYDPRDGMGLSVRFPSEPSLARAEASACTNRSRRISRACSRRAAGRRPTSRWWLIQPPEHGSPTRTTWIPAIHSMSWAARACRRRPGAGQGCWSIKAGRMRPRCRGSPGTRRVAFEQLQPDRDPASPLQFAPKRLQRDHRRDQRL